MKRVSHPFERHMTDNVHLSFMVHPSSYYTKSLYEPIFVYLLGVFLLVKTERRMILWPWSASIRNKRLMGFLLPLSARWKSSRRSSTRILLTSRKLSLPRVSREENVGHVFSFVPSEERILLAWQTLSFARRPNFLRDDMQFKLPIPIARLLSRSTLFFARALYKSLRHLFPVLFSNASYHS